MNFNRFLLGCVIVSLACAPAARARPADPAAAFVSAAFASPPGTNTVTLQAETAKAAADILGQRYPHPTVSYWRADGRTVWILEARGKMHLITAGFVVSNGRIEKSEVLIYREHRGREVQSAAFLNQFKDAALKPDRKLDRTIDGLTGATISVTSMINMARLALFLDSAVSPE